MKKLEFKPDDFYAYRLAPGSAYRLTTHEASHIAQNKFDQWIEREIESAPVVYGQVYTDPYQYNGCVWNKSHLFYHTHKARLALIEPIEPIEPKCEKHEPEISLGKDGIRVSWPVPMTENISQEVFVKVKCKHCHVELVAEWKEVK